jgi:hypothetical protein
MNIKLRLLEYKNFAFKGFNAVFIAFFFRKANAFSIIMESNTRDLKV